MADRRDGSVGSKTRSTSSDRPTSRLPVTADGRFQFIAVHGVIDGRHVERDGRPAVEFTWDGSDEGDRVSGRGWVQLCPDGSLLGHIYFHDGDNSGIPSNLICRVRITPYAVFRRRRPLPPARAHVICSTSRSLPARSQNVMVIAPVSTVHFSIPLSAKPSTSPGSSSRPARDASGDQRMPRGRCPRRRSARRELRMRRLAGRRVLRTQSARPRRRSRTVRPRAPQVTERSRTGSLLCRDVRAARRSARW